MGVVVYLNHIEVVGSSISDVGKSSNAGTEGRIQIAMGW